jgi:hypothetical protein
MEAIAQANPHTIPELAPIMQDLPYRLSIHGEQILKAIKH